MQRVKWPWPLFGPLYAVKFPKLANGMTKEAKLTNGLFTTGVSARNGPRRNTASREDSVIKACRVLYKLLMAVTWLAGLGCFGGLTSFWGHPAKTALDTALQTKLEIAFGVLALLAFGEVFLYEYLSSRVAGWKVE
jgi:hypothetical protein